MYDSQDRLTGHYHQVDGSPEVLLAENTYDELSQLSNKKVGNNLQSIDYAYNIRGWMTHINRDQMSVPDLGGKLFAYRIRYNEKEGITNPDAALFSGKDVLARYNGNIAEVDWRSVENIGNSPSLTPKRYGYAYDKLSRLRAGYYQNPQNPGSKENTESIDYDLNGNITNLYRSSVIESGNTATVIDRLEYFYASGNKSNTIDHITDHQNNPSGYEGGSGVIHHDANGNMDKMQDKNMESIAYNYLNLPHRIVYGGGFKIESKYNTSGIKLQKKVPRTECGIMNCTFFMDTTDYLDGFQYLTTTSTTSGGGGGGSESESMRMAAESAKAFEIQAFSRQNPSTEPLNTMSAKDPDLQFFLTAEGFYDYKKDQYIYQYRDHLGNTRISFARNSAGALEIVDVNDYYPFGMSHLKSGTAMFGQGSYKNYKYNGKELQETGMYDYGARFYMPDIARWGTIDPLAEKYRRHSTYNYAVNNPIRFIDPDGRYVWPPEGGSDGQTWSDSDGNFVNQNGTWYKDDGALMGFLSGSRYQSVNTKNTGGTPGYDGKNMLPDSSYDYTYDLMPGKQADDVNYWKNGESGVMVSRALETTGRDATAIENRTTTIDAVIIVATTPRGGG